MITKLDARQLVDNHINRNCLPGESQWLVVDSKTVETRSGWVFIYASRTKGSATNFIS